MEAELCNCVVAFTADISGPVSGYKCECISNVVEAAVEFVALPNAEVCDAPSGVSVPAELSLLLLAALTSAPGVGDGDMEVTALELNVVAAKGDCTLGKWLAADVPRNCKKKQ